MAVRTLRTAAQDKHTKHLRDRAFKRNTHNARKHAEADELDLIRGEQQRLKAECAARRKAKP